MRLTPALRRAVALPALKRDRSNRRIIWTPAHEALLGTASDQDLADLWGITDGPVYLRRRMLAIPPFGNRGRAQPWTPAMIAALRDHHDSHIAKRFRLTMTTIAIKRRELGIRKQLPHHLAVVWTPVMLKHLGKRLDGEVARDLGLSPRTISAKRRELGIPRLRPTKIDWTSRSVRRLLGSAPDSRVARLLNVAIETVRIKRTAAGIPLPDRPLDTGGRQTPGDGAGPCHRSGHRRRSIGCGLAAAPAWHSALGSAAEGQRPVTASDATVSPFSWWLIVKTRGPCRIGTRGDAGRAP
jgi:hypothetical protein